MIEMLGEYIGAARWFGGKGRPYSVAGTRRLGLLGGSPDPGPALAVDLVTVRYDAGPAAGEEEVYQVPLACYRHPRGHLEHAFVGQWDDPDLGEVFGYDAMHDRDATAYFLQCFDRAETVGGLVFRRLPGHDLDTSVHSTLFSGEQSNSSVAFGEDSLMKLFRKVTPGRNPDIEIHEVLTRAGSDHVAALYGWLEAPGTGGGDVLQLAMLQQFLRTASDGWDLALASVRDLFAEGDLHADEVGGDFGSEAHRLGVATAQVHDALAAGFPTTTWGPGELKGLADAMRGRLEAATAVVPELAGHAEALLEVYARVEGIESDVVVQRVHGDFHLGQTLRTSLGWKIVDFEGEPAKTLAERVLPDSAWRDVAGMLRSFDYAAHAVESDVDVEEEARGQIAYRAAEWALRNQQAFLDGYIEASHRVPDDALLPEQQVLLDAYQADKAVYETVYEARNRPTWIGIPLGALARLTERGSRPGPRPSPAPTTEETL